ncbi:MAG: efflux RND transporter periplasmic adaptor subunit [Sulfuricella denitrificans]|nr:efflux RND transporter periplasmic adaptor subunit [Sulfuricella denitrificans]
MQLKRFLVALNLCWVGLAVAGNDVPMTARQSQALGIETQPIASSSILAGNALPAQVVIPNQQIRIVSAPLPGMVESMAVAVNQTVRKGQVLARLQSPGLAELQRDYLQAALQSQLAQNSLSRDEKLFKDGIVAESRFLATRNSALTSVAAASEKKQALRLAGMGEAAILKLQSGQSVGSALDVVSPIEGVVMEQMLAPGQRVEVAAPLFKVARLSPLWLEIQVPLSQVSALQAGASARVPALQASGKVISIGRGIAEANQTVMVRAEITEGADNLRPGQYVEAVLGMASGAKQWVVGNGALMRDGGETYVFVQTPSGYHLQVVQVLSQTISSATFGGDFKGDEKVVTKGTVALKAAWQGLGKGGE